MKKNIKILAILAIIFSCSVYAQTTEPEEEEIFPKVYTSGATTVTLTADGTMTVAPTNKTGSMKGNVWSVNEMPWVNDRDLVKKVVIQDGVTGLSKFAFSGMTNLEEVSFGKNITAISWGCFSGTTSLKSIDIPDRITFLDESAFSGSGLTSVVLPDTMTRIGLYAFHSTPLTSLVIPDNMALGGQSFGNVALKEITASADQLKNYFAAYGGLASVDQVKIICTSGDCKKFLQEYESWGRRPLAAYADKVIYPKVKNADGSYTLYDGDGNVIGFEGKRIYTIEEANQVTKPTGNTVRIKYR